MFTRDKAYVCAPLAVLALWAALLVVPPAVAEAQGLDPTRDTQGANRAAYAASPADLGGNPDHTASDPPVTGDYEDAGRIVVRPGDSLWSIGEERLAPEASAGRIAGWVGRVYALNRHRIGGDPNLIVPGQELLAPQTPPASAGPVTGATAERSTKPAGRPASGPSEDQARGAASEKASKIPRHPEAGMVALPGLPERGAAPGARSLVVRRTSVVGDASSLGGPVAPIVDRAVAALGALLEVRHDERKLLGLGCFAIAFGAALGLGVLAARRLRERRRARRRASRRGYRGDLAYSDPLAGLDRRPEPAEGKPNPGQSSDEAVETGAAPACAWTEAAGVREPVPDGSPSKATRPDGRKAGRGQEVR